jgi:hypothetical protein
MPTPDDISALPRSLKDKTREKLVSLQQKAQSELKGIVNLADSERLFPAPLGLSGAA